MNKITRQILANEVLIRWRSQYPSTDNEEKMQIFQNLKELGLYPDPDEVDRIIGNDYWTCVGLCHECDKERNALVSVGEEPDYESCTARICISCLKAALELILKGT